MVHVIVFSGLLFMKLPASFAERPRLRERATIINLRDPNYRLYLPILLGGAPVSPPNGKASMDLRPEAPASAGKTKGFSYPGSQPITSDFPEPTNRIQTVLQPKLTIRPILPPPLLLPNIVQMPLAIPVPPPMRVPEPVADPGQRPMARATVPLQLNTIEPLKIEPPPPTNIAKVVPLPVESASKLPQAPAKALSPAPAPENHVQDTIPSETAAKNVEPLLVISPMPATREESVNVPSGEARGRFAISPDPPPVTSTIEPGASVGSSVSRANNAANGADLNSAAGATKDKVSPHDGRHNGQDARVGSVSGPGSSSGSGASNNPFAGITILGAVSSTGGTAKTGNSPNIISIGAPPPPLQTSYGITIISTEASGGGLPQFGVFSNEPVYTVYQDMRRTISDPARSWTFEYAVLKVTNPSNVVNNPNPSQQGLVLPFPLVKEQPVMPADLVHKSVRRQIIVYAVLNAEGKLEHMTVKESPDTLLNEPVVNALSRWAFRPAQLDGKTVPMKVLIGIPLS
jgi:hypothetical protein